MPYRIEKLSLSEIENIFGGCGQVGAQCKKNSDCCGKLKCMATLVGNNVVIINDTPEYVSACVS